MAQMTDETNSLAERANELYWTASMTVDDIVEELGISRSSLYSSIEPMPAGLICADCHERMVFTNRTMRDRGVALCPNCGRESEPGEPRGATGEEMEGAAGAVGGPDADEGYPVSRTLVIPPQRIALVAGGAALGIVVGALAAGLLRESR
jgi:hypothetical protein